jgi:hypothetical protein
MCVAGDYALRKLCDPGKLLILTEVGSELELCLRRPRARSTRRGRGGTRGVMRMQESELICTANGISSPETCS